MAKKELRVLARDIFDSLAWPTGEEEFWRRTNLHRLLPKGSLDKASKSPKHPDDSLPSLGKGKLPEAFAARIKVENGVPKEINLSAKASQAGLSLQWYPPAHFPATLEGLGRKALETKPDRLTAWHWRDTPGAVVLHLPADTLLQDPVIIEEWVSENVQSDQIPNSNPHLHIHCGKSAELAVLWSLGGNSGTKKGKGITFVNAGLSAQLQENAKLNLSIHQNYNKETAFFLDTEFVIERDAQLSLCEVNFGTALTKTRNRSILSAPGAHAELRGLFLASKGQHMDVGTVQEHRAPQTTSTALYKTAVQSGGYSIFQGVIEVAAKASKTDAYLTNKNLVLDDVSRADSMPKLDILTDDVKCSHGSTTGKLDESQIFYLLNRGFSPEEAREELTRGFLQEILDKAPPAIEEILSRDLDVMLQRSYESVV